MYLPFPVRIQILKSCDNGTPPHPPSFRCSPGHQGDVCQGVPPLPIHRVQTASSSGSWNPC